MKQCPKCEQHLPRAAYYSDKTKKDGLGSKCRDCHRAYYRARDDRAARKRLEEKRELFTVGMKRCKDCSQVLSLTDFPAKTNSKDGHRAVCAVCWRTYFKKWSAANPEKMKRYGRASKLRRADADRAYNAQWFQDNKERLNEQRREWRAQNRVRWNAYGNLRRARKTGAAGFATAEAIEARIAYYGRRCWMCGGPFEHLDHVIPLSRGGTNWPANLRPACQSCNVRKHNKLPHELAA